MRASAQPRPPPSLARIDGDKGMAIMRDCFFDLEEKGEGLDMGAAGGGPHWAGAAPDTAHREPEQEPEQLKSQRVMWSWTRARAREAANQKMRPWYMT